MRRPTRPGDAERAGRNKRPRRADRPERAADRRGSGHRESADRVIGPDCLSAGARVGQIDDQRLARGLADLPQSADDRCRRQMQERSGCEHGEGIEREEHVRQDDEGLLLRLSGEDGGGKVGGDRGRHEDRGEQAELRRRDADDLDRPDDEEDVRESLAQANEAVRDQELPQRRPKPRRGRTSGGGGACADVVGAARRPRSSPTSIATDRTIETTNPMRIPPRIP